MQAATHGRFTLGIGLGTKAYSEPVFGAEHFDAGATDVVFAQTDLGSDADRRRTWQLLGELARGRGEVDA